MQNTTDATCKTCIRCERVLSVGDFNRSAGSADGLHSYCRRCMAEYSKARRLPAPLLDARKCEYCDREYVPQIRGQRFCRPACKQGSLYWRRHPREERACGECGKDISDTRRDKVWCSDVCANRNRRRERPEIRRRHHLKKHYGITLEDYDAMLDRQGGGCAICKTDQILGYGKQLAIDHCHDTGKVRGILCGNCNRGIGAFGNDPERLRAAAMYLE